MNGLISKHRTNLGEISEDISYGYTASAISEPHGPKFLRITDIVGVMDWKKVPYCIISPENLKKYQLEIGDIVVARTGATTGSTYLIKEKINAVFASYLIRFKINKQIADPFFIGALLKSQSWRDFIESNIGGSAQPGINAKTLSHFTFDLPPLPEQQAIADVLSALDDKIELNRRMNQTLEDFARAIYKHMFIDNPDSKKWEDCPLPDLFDFLEGPGIRNWQYTNCQEGIRFINIRCIHDSDIDLSSANRVSEDEAFGKYRHFLLSKDDVIVSTSGTLGRYAIVREEHLPLMLNTSVIRFRPKSEKASWVYLIRYIGSQAFQLELETRASGSVQSNFGPVHLKQISLTIPPRNLMSTFTQIADPIQRKILLNLSENDQLTSIRDTLLPKLMSGQVRVNPSVIASE